jgi:(p)ppGpp synthase/HD superfamily hydrolase
MSDGTESKSDPEFMSKLYTRLWGEYCMMSIIHAEGVAQRAHAGQTRKNGEPYYNHVYRVAEQFASDNHPENGVVALLHDVLEDCKDPAVLNDLKIVGEKTMATLKLLTRVPGETYFDFIHRIAASGDQTAIAVKIADLKDNLRDLEEGHQKDKYRFALALLEDAIRVRQQTAEESH